MIDLTKLEADAREADKQQAYFLACEPATVLSLIAALRALDGDPEWKATLAEHGIVDGAA